MSLRDQLFNRSRQTRQAAPHTPAAAVFDRAPTDEMREWDIWDQDPMGVVPPERNEVVQRTWNAHFRSRFGMSWMGGLYPNQPLPSPMIKDASVSWRRMFQSAYVNQSTYLRHGGSAPVGIGPVQVQAFKEASDHTKPASGQGPGYPYSGPNLMPFFGAVDL